MYTSMLQSQRRHLFPYVLTYWIVLRCKIVCKIVLLLLLPFITFISSFYYLYFFDMDHWSDTNKWLIDWLIDCVLIVWTVNDIVSVTFRSSTYCTDVRLSCHNKRIIIIIIIIYTITVFQFQRYRLTNFLNFRSKICHHRRSRRLRFTV